VKRHGNESEGLLEGREDGGSQRADSQGPGADGERSGTNKLGYGELRKEPSERARWWGSQPDMGEYRVGSAGGARAEGDARK